MVLVAQSWRGRTQGQTPAATTCMPSGSYSAGSQCGLPGASQLHGIRQSAVSWHYFDGKGGGHRLLDRWRPSGRQTSTPKSVLDGATQWTTNGRPGQRGFCVEHVCPAPNGRRWQAGALLSWIFKEPVNRPDIYMQRVIAPVSPVGTPMIPISTADANSMDQSWQADSAGEPLCAGLITPRGPVCPLMR